ncbi:NUDIX hydrolase [Parvularcula dongshanensis]|uniref:ADP-ribose pyrophosphatase YjhB (NUDIX family) n=1 Tax=Parvularcula dongshanensis TaxID=1173995 RepID=A0A840I1H6_9PROT|nr:NUDIX hydrolase [Parvularcula dongshanensis]MBB4658082.1 ADP-ribose pyrophosphatase YjhB (NUDIX family) [Parvularcula dongshanensis]
MPGSDDQQTPSVPPAFVRTRPPGDEHERDVCTRCGYVAYQNPKVVAGSVASSPDGLILLCRRAIEPAAGLWTLPAGYMEMGETVEEAARREAREEAGAELELERVLAVYSVPHIGQVQVMFRARLSNPEDIVPGPESLALQLVKWEDVPWPELAFPSVVWALRAWHEVRGRSDFAPFANPPEGL